MRSFIKNRRGGVEVKLYVFVFLACFIGFWGAMIGFMPDTLASGPTEYPEMNYPEDVFHGIDIVQFADVCNYTVGPNFNEDFELGGHDMHIAISKTVRWINIYHYYGFFQYDYKEWYNDLGISRGEYLYQDEIVEDADANNVSTYLAKCQHFTMRAWLDYNNTLYTDFEDAWDNDAGKLLLAISFDQAGTAYNGWSTMADLLTFKAPNVNPYLNVFIALPIWVAVICFIVLIVAEVLPFV